VAKIATRVNAKAPKSARLDAKKFSAGLFNVRPSTTWRTKDHPAHQLPCRPATPTEWHGIAGGITGMSNGRPN
jgi:hypothetical protein